MKAVWTNCAPFIISVGALMGILALLDVLTGTGLLLDLLSGLGSIASLLLGLIFLASLIGALAMAVSVGHDLLVFGSLHRGDRKSSGKLMGLKALGVAGLLLTCFAIGNIRTMLPHPPSLPQSDNCYEWDARGSHRVPC